MNRGVWVGGLFLSLCGWAAQAGAQEVIWRPVTRPGDPPPPARLQVLPAALGRPTPAPAPTPPPAVAPPTGVIAASYRADTAPKPVSRTWPDGLDGLDPVPTDAPAASSSALPPGMGFAAERGIPATVCAAEPILAAPKAGAAPEEAGPTLMPPTPQEVAAVTPPPPPPVDASPEEAAAPADDFGLFQNLASWRPHFYARAEYLLWSVTKDTVPPLVTTSTNPLDFGILGRPTTQVLFGGDGLDGGDRSGARLTAGLWLDDCETKGIEVSGFFLGRETETFNASSAQFPVLARPFFSENRNAEFVQLTAFGNQATGAVNVRDSSTLWGMEANARCCLCCGGPCADDCNGCPAWHYRVDGLAGFRYLNLQEDLSITENTRNFPSPTNQLTILTDRVTDDFATKNQFYGAQVGLDGTVDLGRWSLNLMGKLAVGDTQQEVSIHGGQTFTNLNGTTGTAVGGLLALPSNIGTFHRDAFSVVPEGDVTVSYHVSDHVRVFAGYDALYWSSVVRPGQQIDRTLDETQIPNFEPPGTVAPAGQNRPAVTFQRSDIWAQGLNLGLEFRY